MWIEKLKKEVMFSFWEKYDETHTVIRFVTSWATTREDLEALDRALERVYTARQINLPCGISG